jgi:hypothetical protein
MDGHHGVGWNDQVGPFMGQWWALITIGGWVVHKPAEIVIVNGRHGAVILDAVVQR